MTTRPRLPQPAGLDAEWHRCAATTGRLHLQRCTDCGAFHHPPRYYCDACASPDWQFVPCAERGSVHSFTVTHRSVDPAWADQVPYTTVVVQLDEGPRLVTALRHLAPEAPQLGHRLRIRVEILREDETVSLWAEPDR